MATAASETAAAPATLAPPKLTRSLPQGRFVSYWALAWLVVGCAVGAGIAIYQSDVDIGPALQISVLFAEVVGFTALLSARVVFPLLVRLPYWPFMFLQIFTLLSVTIFGSITVIRVQPLFAAARPVTLALIVLINALLAVIVGIALHTYDNMRLQLERSFQVLRERDALERELAVARDVQQELLPRQAPHFEGLELTGLCVPAVGVGGDLFDFLPLDRNRVALVIADVSGKGVPAALLMAGLQASVRSLTRPDVAPAELNGRVNDMLYRASPEARYATFLFGIYDARSRTFCFSNAGHHPPLLVNSNHVARLEAPAGFPIGMFDGSSYAEQAHALKPGDLLTLFTDGVVETFSPDGEEFGEERLTRLLCRHQARPLDEIVTAVMDELDRFGGGAEAHDDATLLLARAR